MSCPPLMGEGPWVSDPLWGGVHASFNPPPPPLGVPQCPAPSPKLGGGGAHYHPATLPPVLMGGTPSVPPLKRGPPVSPLHPQTPGGIPRVLVPPKLGGGGHHHPATPVLMGGDPQCPSPPPTNPWGTLSVLPPTPSSGGPPTTLPSPSPCTGSPRGPDPPKPPHPTEGRREAGEEALNYSGLFITDLQPVQYKTYSSRSRYTNR